MNYLFNKNSDLLDIFPTIHDLMFRNKNATRRSKKQKQYEKFRKHIQNRNEQKRDENIY